MDNQRRLSQEQLQHAQQVAERDLVRGLAHEIKKPLGGLRNLVNRLLDPQQPGMHVTQSIHQVCERVFKLVSLEMPDNVTLVRNYDPSLPELTHDPDQIEQVLLNITRNSLQALGKGGRHHQPSERIPPSN